MIGSLVEVGEANITIAARDYVPLNNSTASRRARDHRHLSLEVVREHKHPETLWLRVSYQRGRYTRCDTNVRYPCYRLGGCVEWQTPHTAERVRGRQRLS
jgi:hypothetical protein